jgi:uncharacterized protein YkwD
MSKYLYVALIALTVLTACQPAPQPTPAEPPTILPPTVTALPSATPTVAPTLVPTVVPTALPTITPTSQPTVTPTTAPTFQVQVNSPDVGYVNVRDAPSTGGALVAQAKDRATLDVLELASTARGKIGQMGQWLKVRTPDGKEGFAAAWYLSLPGASPAPTSAPPDLAGAALELFNRANAFRLQNGLLPFRYSSLLAASAERHSQDMAETGNISHTGSDGSTVRQRVADTGYGNWPTDEVVFGGVATVDDAWQFWITDPHHRAVLLNPKLLEAGVSLDRGSAHTTFYTMDFGARPAGQ